MEFGGGQLSFCAATVCSFLTFCFLRDSIQRILFYGVLWPLSNVTSPKAFWKRHQAWNLVNFAPKRSCVSFHALKLTETILDILHTVDRCQGFNCVQNPTGFNRKKILTNVSMRIHTIIVLDWILKEELYQIYVFEIVVSQSSFEIWHQLFHLLLPQFALLHLTCKIRSNSSDTSLQFSPSDMIIDFLKHHKKIRNFLPSDLKRIFFQIWMVKDLAWW